VSEVCQEANIIDMLPRDYTDDQAYHNPCIALRNSPTNDDNGEEEFLNLDGSANQLSNSGEIKENPIVGIGEHAFSSMRGSYSFSKDNETVEKLRDMIHFNR